MLSHIHKTLFVHIPKCGGTSIETAFLASLQLTWNNRAPLLLRPRIVGELAPPRLAHLLLKDYIQNCYISSALYEEYFKFAVVRDPYERVRSFFYYHQIYQKKKLNDFVSEDLNQFNQPSNENFWFFRPQVDFLQAPEGLSELNRIYHLEQLDNDWIEITEKTSLSIAKLAHINQSKLPANIQKEQLTQASKLIIREIYAKDFERFPIYDV